MCLKWNINILYERVSQLSIGQHSEHILWPFSGIFFTDLAWDRGNLFQSLLHSPHTHTIHTNQHATSDTMRSISWTYTVWFVPWGPFTPAYYLYPLLSSPISPPPLSSAHPSPISSFLSSLPLPSPLSLSLRVRHRQYCISVETWLFFTALQSPGSRPLHSSTIQTQHYRHTQLYTHTALHTQLRYIHPHNYTAEDRMHSALIHTPRSLTATP